MQLIRKSHIALDLGLRTTGAAWGDGSDHFACPNRLTSSPMTQTKKFDRLTWWAATFAAILVPHEGCDVIVEAPFIHSKNPSGAVELIKLHGVLANVASGGGHAVHSVSPSELKQWATGKGNANKCHMLDAARRLGWVGDDHNEADAYLLWSMWAEHEAAA